MITKATTFEIEDTKSEQLLHYEINYLKGHIDEIN